MNRILSNFLQIGSGVALTLELTAGSLLIGILLGVFFSILRYGGVGKSVINGIIAILRGTPIFLQLAFMYFIIPRVIGFRLSLLSTGIVAFGMNSSAYMAEIIRAGIESLPKGQFEAAQTLEIPPYYMWRDIILPQVIVNIFPAIVNEMIALLKETALIAAVGGMDIMKQSQIIAAEQYDVFTPLIIAGLYYYGLTLLIGFLGKKFEKRNLHARTS